MKPTKYSQILSNHYTTRRHLLTKSKMISTNMKTKLDIKVDDDEAESSHIVASIEDLLAQILLHLPIRSLVRFKSVSKNWHSLITNPRFYNLRNSSLDPPIGLFLPSTKNFWEYVPLSRQQSRKPLLENLDFVKDSASRFMILQSCNGLFLCCTSDVYPKRRYYVCNPTTKRFTKLPKLKENTWMAHWMSLAFDPTRSPNHYKVVCVRRLESNSRKYQYQIKIYSHSTDSWRICIEPFTTDANFENGLYWNGAIHWLSDEFRRALYFKIDDQILGSMQMPNITPLNGWYWRTNCYFGESCGHLHYIDIRRRYIQFDVYEMKRDYSEWYVKYKVDLSPVVASYPEMFEGGYRSSYSIFSVVPGERGGDSFLVLLILGKVIRFNLGSKTLEMLHEFEGEGGFRYWGTNGFQYIESVCCV